jgi:hypothetical protein
VTNDALSNGTDWECARCGGQWNATRLATAAAYALWLSGHNNAASRGHHERVPLDVQAGDTILFDKHSGQEVRVDGVDYLIMKEGDVLGLDTSSAASDDSQMNFSWSI